MSSQYQECLDLSQNLEREINDFSRTVERLGEEVANVSFISFKGINLRFEIEMLQKEIEVLKKRVGSIRVSVEALSKNVTFSTSEATELNLIWGRMMYTAKQFKPALNTIKDMLESNNLWAGLISTFEQIFQSIKEVIINLTGIVFRTAAGLISAGTTLLLPEWDEDE